MIGIGAMLHTLKGGSEHGPQEYIGKTVKSAKINQDVLTLEFSDGVSIEIFDDGQSCCESRYMSTDDDVTELEGQTLIGIEVKGAEEKDRDYDLHEIAFLEIQGNHSSVTVATHNEHNGYYGGFGLSIREVNPTTPNQEER